MTNKNLAILLIEDSQLYRDFICSQLRSKLCISKLDVADTERLGRKLVEENEYDLIISDTMRKHPYLDCDYPYGPEIVMYARNLGITAIVIAISTNPDNKSQWNERGIKYDYFFEKGTFNSEKVKEVILNESLKQKVK